MYNIIGGTKFICGLLFVQFVQIESFRSLPISTLSHQSKIVSLLPFSNSLPNKILLDSNFRLLYARSLGDEIGYKKELNNSFLTCKSHTNFNFILLEIRNIIHTY
jgi:hypothetical protein